MATVQGKSTTNAPIHFDGNFTQRKYQLPPIITSTITSQCIILFLLFTRCTILFLLSTLTSNHGSYLRSICATMLELACTLTRIRNIFSVHDLKRDQAGNYKRTNNQKQHFQVKINLLALRCLAREAIPMPPMEGMAIAIRKPCSRPISSSLRETMHLEAQQRKKPSNGGRESVISPPTASHRARGATSTHEPWVLLLVLIGVVRLRGSGRPLPGRPAGDLNTRH